MTRIYYLRKPGKIVYGENNTYSVLKGEPTVCLVSERNGESGEIRYGYSIYNQNDHFDKKEARRWAEKRLDEEPIVFTSEAKSSFEINKSMIENFSENIGKKNGKARKLAYIWLKDRSKPKPVAQAS